MKKLIQISILLHLTLICSVCALSQNKEYIPHIQYGEAIIKGVIKGVIPSSTILDTSLINLSFVNPITAELVNYKIVIKRDSSFQIRIPVACATIGALESKIYEGIISVCLVPNEETQLTITFDEEVHHNIYTTNSFNSGISEGATCTPYVTFGKNGRENIDIKSSLSLTSYDMTHMSTIILETLMQNSIGNEKYDMPPDEFSKFAINRIEDILSSLNSEENLSELAKGIVLNNLKLFYLDNVLFDYKMRMKLSYREKHPEDIEFENFHIEEPDIFYYSFLKYFNLNNADYLFCDYYSIVLQKILENKTIGILPIGEMAISDWIKITSEKLKDKVGFETGLFYDMLVANSYAMQLNEMEPLTDRQKKNIESYFSNPSFARILLNESKAVMNLDTANKKAKTFKINETPDVSAGDIMNAIISKYKGKVVFVDFWATWCGPCLKAMEESEAVKKQFKDKNVVFVYITNESSPRKVWERKLAEIGGEHYYLDENDWNHLLDSLEFTGIPTYLIYDVNGILKRKNTAFMGVKNMEKWIEELLKKQYNYEYTKNNTSDLGRR